MQCIPPNIGHYFVSAQSRKIISNRVRLFIQQPIWRSHPKMKK